jgi:hypothetical protein
MVASKQMEIDMTKTYTSRKTCPGVYVLTFDNGALVRVARHDNGLWNTFLVGREESDRDSWMQTYCTKADAIAELVTCAHELI